jgi:DNA-binding transcriptional LysR family regulator
MLDSQRLLTFREVARHGSFSRAAAALARSQPSVSHQVAALERELGTRLLVRGRAGAVPTEAGALLLWHADALAAQLELAGRQMDSLVTATRHVLEVGAVPSALSTIVPAAIARLRSDEPELQVAVKEGTVDQLEEGLRAGRLHLAVSFQDAHEPRKEYQGMQRTELGDDPMLALIPETHRLAGRASIDLRELADDPWIVPALDGFHVKACRAAGFEPRVVVVTRDRLAVCAIAGAGLGVSLTPRLLPRSGITLPGIATPELRGTGPHRALFALTPAKGMHPLARAFLDALADAASE